MGFIGRVPGVRCREDVKVEAALVLAACSTLQFGWASKPTACCYTGQDEEKKRVGGRGRETTDGTRSRAQEKETRELEGVEERRGREGKENEREVREAES